MAVSDQKIEHEILNQIASAKSVAPRDVATVLAGEGEDWRRYLSRIRSVAVDLHGKKQLLFIRKKKSVSPERLKGVFRLASPQNYEVSDA